MAEPVLICDARADRRRWLEERRRGIGSSDAPAVLGLGHGSPTSVYAAKVLDVDEQEEPEGPEQKRGHILQATIGRWLADSIGGYWADQELLVRSAEEPWMLATGDGWVWHKQRGSDLFTPGEIKAWWSGDWSEGPPGDVWVQCQHQLFVWDRETMYLAALVYGAFKWWPIERDHGFIENTLLPAERELWQRIEAGEPPPPDESVYTEAALRKLYPADRGGTCEFDASFLDIDAELETVKAEQARLVERRRYLENTIRLTMRDASVAVLPNGVEYRYGTDKSGKRVLRRARGGTR